MERITITIKPVLLGEIKKLLNMRKSVSKIINEWLEEVLFERKKGGMKVLEVIERSSFNEVSEKVINGNYCRFYEFVKKSYTVDE